MHMHMHIHIHIHKHNNHNKHANTTTTTNNNSNSNNTSNSNNNSTSTSTSTTTTTTTNNNNTSKSTACHFHHTVSLSYLNASVFATVRQADLGLGPIVVRAKLKYHAKADEPIQRRAPDTKRHTVIQGRRPSGIFHDMETV